MLTFGHVSLDGDVGLHSLIAIHTRIPMSSLHLFPSLVMSLFPLEWFILFWETALQFRGMFTRNIGRCHSSVHTSSATSTNMVLNLLTIYAINCGILTLWVSTLTGVDFFLIIVQLAEYLLSPPSYWYCSLLLLVTSWLTTSKRRSSHINIRCYTSYPPSLWFGSIFARSWPCMFSLLATLQSSRFTAFYFSLNSWDKLRVTLNSRDIILGTMPNFMPPIPPNMAVACGVQVMTESRSNTADSKIHSPVQVSSYHFWLPCIQCTRQASVLTG